jgi:hypothetical protein
MKSLLALLVVGALGFAGYVLLMLNWSYSAGERAGYVQKLSRKGWVCKTWEGEMALVSMPGTVAEKFLFTVPDDAIAEQINRSIGSRVTLYYEQHVGLPTHCWGDTQYFVTRVTPVAGAPPLPPPAS